MVDHEASQIVDSIARFSELEEILDLGDEEILYHYGGIETPATEETPKKQQLTLS